MFTENILLIQVTQIIISNSAVQKIGRRAVAWRSSLWDSSESNSFVGLTDSPLLQTYAAETWSTSVLSHANDPT